MLRRFSPHFLSVAILLAFCAFIPSAQGEELTVIDDFTTGFTFANLYSTDFGKAAPGINGTFQIGGNATMGWTDSAASGIIGGTRTVTVTDYVGDGGVVQGQVNGGQIEYAGALSARAKVILDYSFSATDFTGKENLTFAIDFDLEAAQSTRALIEIGGAAGTTTAEVAFFNTSGPGTYSINLDNLQTAWDWNATTWSDIKDEVTSLKFTFENLDFAEDYSFATQSFSDTDRGGLTQVPEPTSLILLGTILGSTCFRGRRRRA